MIKAYNEAIKKELKQKGEHYQNEDIIVNKYLTVETPKENGIIELKRQKFAVNVTKKVNETAKLIKQDQALNKIKELAQIFTTKE